MRVSYQSKTHAHNDTVLYRDTNIVLLTVERVRVQVFLVFLLLLAPDLFLLVVLIGAKLLGSGNG